jgi:hypothetical protein
MLDPGTRISLVRDGQIVVRGDQCVVFTYMNTYTIIGRDDQGETTFGIYDSHCVEPYCAPQGPQIK